MRKQCAGNLSIKNMRCLLKISTDIVVRCNRKQGGCQGTGMAHIATGNTNQI